MLWDLDGWKAIAAFLGVSERTARRWKGLPVERYACGGCGRPRVVAHRRVILRWVKSRRV